MFGRWLLRDPDMKVRSNYGPYQEAVNRFFGQLIPMVTDLQVSLKYAITCIKSNQITNNDMNNIVNIYKSQIKKKFT